MRRALRGRIASIIGCRVEVLIGLRVRRLRRTFYSAAVLVGWNPRSRKREYSTVTEDRKTGRQEDRKTGRQEDRKTGRQEDRKTGRQEDRKTGRQEDRRTGGQEDRQPHYIA
jgi:hypothetical protein